ncbi:MAG TPA: citrate/2-methylcitrate synthase, partial [Gemmatimonadaceae bacterium]|nr:citrate/2-methylcitrate synthase [Gemmatimonadaceae bacterium]
MSTEKAQPAGGLRGVSAGQTAIASVGDGHGLRYRGYDVVELAAHATFEEVAYLLLRGELPTARQLDAFRIALRSRRELPRTLCEVLERIPSTAHP